MTGMKNMSLVRSTINSTRQIITGGRRPEGNCTIWNQDLAIALRMQGIFAIPYGSPSYKIKARRGGTTEGHCVAICKIEEGWAAIDLSSAQIEGLGDEKIWEANSLANLCAAVNENIPDFMRYKRGDEEKMIQAATKSAEKDRREGRYDRFADHVTSGESKE